MQYKELSKLDIQKHFSTEINKLRQLSVSNSDIGVETNPLWVPAIRAMFDRDCTSRSTSEFLIERYLPQDRNSEKLKKVLNVEVVTLLIVSALMNPKVEQKILFCSEVLSTFMACDIAAVVRRNFVDYELVVMFNLVPTQRIVFRLIANK